MLAKILIAVAVLVIVLLVVVAFQPSDFRVERRVAINASPANVFSEVNNLHRWERWSPWEKLDPQMKRSFEGPAEGVGAVYAWEGNNEVGTGRMTITESRPAEIVRLKLEFFKPMAGVSVATFDFKPEGGQTTVVWSMTGENNFIGKAMCLVMNMDKMMGGQFEQGLAQLKTVSESATKP